jgi:hypothetical protein
MRGERDTEEIDGIFTAMPAKFSRTSGYPLKKRKT